MSFLNNLDRLYKLRFSKKEFEFKKQLWKILCEDYFQKYIKNNDTVLDLGTGYCDFINHIDCDNKIAIDVNPISRAFANKNVKVFIRKSTNLPKSLYNKVDVVFAACLLEHLASREDLLKTFIEVYKVLRPNGIFIILNPNIRFSTSDYWDYFDHLLPLSDRSVTEGLRLTNFTVIKLLPKFVPNTIKDNLPKSIFLLRIYLRLPILFCIFGRQMLIIAKK